MKLIVAVFAAALVVAGLYPTVDKEEQFALELEACQEAMAAGTPSACDLYGEIEIVEHHGDVQIETTQHHADIQVKWVDHHANSPGEWKQVDHHADYQVELVEHHGDYDVEFVEHHPGCD